MGEKNNLIQLRQAEKQTKQKFLFVRVHFFLKL
jgi:hypothetical protein